MRKEGQERRKGEEGQGEEDRGRGKEGRERRKEQEGHKVEDREEAKEGREEKEMKGIKRNIEVRGQEGWKRSKRQKAGR
jgi:hypothetical protein